jgi:hypothetical protein
MAHKAKGFYCIYYLQKLFSFFGDAIESRASYMLSMHWVLEFFSFSGDFHAQPRMRNHCSKIQCSNDAIFYNCKNSDLAKAKNYRYKDLDFTCARTRIAEGREEGEEKVRVTDHEECGLHYEGGTQLKILNKEIIQQNLPFKNVALTEIGKCGLKELESIRLYQASKEKLRPKYRYWF